MEGYLLYSTDAWHSWSSKELLGVFTNVEALDNALWNIINDNKKNFEKWDDEDEDISVMFDRIKEEMDNCHGQTQGYEENLLIEKIELNELI